MKAARKAESKKSRYKPTTEMSTRMRGLRKNILIKNTFEDDAAARKSDEARKKASIKTHVKAPKCGMTSGKHSLPSLPTFRAKMKKAEKAEAQEEDEDDDGIPVD